MFFLHLRWEEARYFFTKKTTDEKVPQNSTSVCKHNE